MAIELAAEGCLSCYQPCFLGLLMLFGRIRSSTGGTALALSFLRTGLHVR